MASLNGRVRRQQQRAHVSVIRNESKDVHGPSNGRKNILKWFKTSHKAEEVELEDEAKPRVVKDTPSPPEG
jgi:hypothetical protein